MLYEKNKTNRITLRLNDEQFAFVRSNSDVLGVSPSDFLRMVINSTMVNTKRLEDNIHIVREVINASVNADERIGAGRENDKTDFDNLV